MVLDSRTSRNSDKNLICLSCQAASIIAASAALAMGGSLALAASASAAQIPWGSSTDTGTTSVYGLLNNAYGGLDQADFALSGELSDPAVPSAPPQAHRRPGTARRSRLKPGRAR